MALDRHKMTHFWKRSASRSSVRVNLSLPASTFTKSGTAWETQLIVIDKRGPTAGANWAEQVKNIRHGSATLLEILTLARENKLLPNPIAPHVPSPAPETTSDQTPIVVASETHELAYAAEAVTNDQVESDASD